MKYLFVIYTDSEYKKHLDYFKSQKFYKEILDDSIQEAADAMDSLLQNGLDEKKNRFI